MTRIYFYFFFFIILISCKNNEETPKNKSQKTQETKTKPTHLTDITWGSFLEKMKEDNAIFKFNQELAESPHKAFLFECNPIRYEKLDETKFEYTLISDKILDKKSANPSAFSKEISTAHKKGERSTHFLNLGKNARLIIPSNLDKKTKTKQFAHIARFVREASKEDILSFWKTVFTSLKNELQEKHKKNPNQWTWLNTHGHGVPWLHMRVDSRPKYYSHSPYKTPAQ